MAIKIIPATLRPTNHIPHREPGDIEVITAPYSFHLDGVLSEAEWEALQAHIPSAERRVEVEIDGNDLDDARQKLSQILHRCGIQIDE